MDKQKGKRINFRIVHCSSQDPEYPVAELLKQSPEAKGWQNKRFSSYPETIVIELAELSLITKIAVLSHQSKIATKVEFQIKLSEEDQWKKLGRISLDSNVNTNFQARELKQANINEVQAKFIRLILRNNHVNNQNIFNQVGLISISFYGGKASNQGRTFEDKTPTAFPSKSSGQVDQTTIARIQQLEMKKRIAVDNQNFDLAKDIKQQIDRVKSVAVQITRLQERKQQAIRRQNYDDAKIINQEIKRLRSGNGAQQLPMPLRQAKPQSKAIRPEPTVQAHSYHQQQYQHAVSPVTNHTRNPGTHNNNPGSNNRNVGKALSTLPQKQKKAYEAKPPLEEDDRPLNVKAPNHYGNGPSQYEEEEQRKGGELEPLNKQLFQQCAQYFSVFDEDVFRHLFSKDHSNRQKGINMISDELTQTKNKQQFLDASLFIIKNLVDDKIASIVIALIGFMEDMMKKLKPQLNAVHIPLVDYILDRIADNLGHNNQKIRVVNENIFRTFPIYHLTNKDTCYRALTTVGKRDKPPKILAGRLKMVSTIVSQYQLGKDYQSVIKYAVRYADDKNNDVRTAAINTLCTIAAEITYGTLQPFLKNLRPPIIKTIQQKLDQNGQNEPQRFDQKPIRPNKSSNKATRKAEMEEDFQGGNEFVSIPKKAANPQNSQYTCDFCKRVDKRFAEEDYKDLHFFNACPMLTICHECGQAVEISSFTAHLVGECANSKYYKKCPRCKEAVHQKHYKAHVEKKECLPAKPMAAANRCPLCHLDIGAGPGGWKQHLVDQGCQNNPRA